MRDGEGEWSCGVPALRILDDCWSHQFAEVRGVQVHVDGQVVPVPRQSATLGDRCNHPSESASPVMQGKALTS